MLYDWLLELPELHPELVKNIRLGIVWLLLLSIHFNTRALGNLVVNFYRDPEAEKAWDSSENVGPLMYSDPRDHLLGVFYVPATVLHVYFLQS